MHLEEKVRLNESNQMDQGVVEAGTGFRFVLVWPVVDSCMVLTLNINITWSHIEGKRPKSPLSQRAFKCRNSIHIILHRDVINQSFNVYSNGELLTFWKHYLSLTCPSLGSSYFPQDDFFLVTPSPWFWFCPCQWHNKKPLL